jgi:hypothetical protein
MSPQNPGEKRKGQSGNDQDEEEILSGNGLAREAELTV